MPTRSRSSRRLPGKIALLTALFAVGLPACTPPPGGGQPVPTVTAPAPSPAPSSPGAKAPTPVSVDEVTAFAGQQLRAISEHLGVDQYPVTTDAAGAWTTKDATAWTSGFLPGSFWQLHELTGEPAWAEKARAWQAGVASQRTRTDTHDLGFMLMSSVGNDARVTDDPTARQAVLEGAASLAARHDPAVGVLKAHWDWAPGDVKIIVDQTMNLELLLWAASHGGDAGLRDIAVSHGLKARESLVRPDGSTFHVAAFDSSGALQSQYTHQGAGDDTAWARGQAWAVYGFTVLYRETQDERFLQTVRAVSDYYVAHLPSDHVPYWDFSVTGQQGEPRDTSAAAVAASGLLELSELDPEPARSATYREAAVDTLMSLSSPPYLAHGTESASILLHGTQNKPDGNFDTGMVVGDHYFLEALRRYAAGIAAD